MPDVDSQVAVRIDLRDGIFRAWTGMGALSLDETTTVEEGTIEEVGAGFPSLNCRGLEFFGATLWLCTWGTSPLVWSVNPDTGAVAAVGSSGQESPNSLFEVDGGRYLVLSSDTLAPVTNAGVVSASESVAPLPARSRIEAATQVGGVVYAWINERSLGTRALYSLAKSGATWTPTRIADMGANIVRGVAVTGDRILGVSRRSGADYIVDLTVEGGATDVWRVPSGTSPMFGLAVSPAGVVYGVSQRSLYRMTLPGSSVSSEAYLDADATGLVEATLPSLAEEDGAGTARLVVASDLGRWKASQGPVSIEIREVTRAPGGSWTPSPLPFRYVLGDSTYQAGVWRANAVPVTRSARHAARVPEWSSLNQLARTGGSDTSFSRLRSTGRALPFPSRFNR